MKNVIEAIILNGKFQSENILLQFKRLKFQIRLAFAMTINKSEDQTMSVA
jgi:hypothetical protein